MIPVGPEGLASRYSPTLPQTTLPAYPYAAIRSAILNERPGRLGEPGGQWPRATEGKGMTATPGTPGVTGLRLARTNPRQQKVGKE